MNVLIEIFHNCISEFNLYFTLKPFTSSCCCKCFVVVSVCLFSLIVSNSILQKSVFISSNF